MCLCVRRRARRGLRTIIDCTSEYRIKAYVYRWGQKTIISEIRESNYSIAGDKQSKTGQVHEIKGGFVLGAALTDAQIRRRTYESR